MGEPLQTITLGVTCDAQQTYERTAFPNHKTVLLRVKISVTLQFIKNSNIVEDPSDRLPVSLSDKFLCLCSECCICHNDDEF